MESDHGLYLASVLLVPILIAVTFHEAAHGFIAYQLGDDTAWRAGRVTFNPLKHVDPFGTIVLPALLYITSGFIFGYAKPVPVNFGRLRHPRRDTVLVALAGPGTNVLLAFVSSLLLYTLGQMPVSTVVLWFAFNLQVSISINALLCVFNMLPLPPLDGGRVAVSILPSPIAFPLARLERYGMLIVLLLLFVSYAGRRYGCDPLNWLIFQPTQALSDFIRSVTGTSE